MAWSNESRHKRGYGSAWDKIRKLVLVRDKHLCQPCLRSNKPTAGSQVDHITPKAKGGTDDMDNLETICDPCHKAKTARDNGKEYKPKRTTGIDGWPV
jgi:5-methylcytosine-specific restriction protein A